MLSLDQVAGLLRVARARALNETFLERMAVVSQSLGDVIPFAYFTAVAVNPLEPAPPAAEHLFVHEYAPAALADYAAHYSALDPAFHTGLERPGLPMVYSDWFPDPAFGRDEFTSEMLSRHGTRFAMGTMLRLSADQWVAVCLHRPHGRQDFTAQEREVFGLVLPDVASAAHDGLITLRLRGLRAGRGDSGALTFDAHGALSHADARALALLDLLRAVGASPLDTLAPAVQRVRADSSAPAIQRCFRVPGGLVRASISAVPGGAAAILDLLPAGTPAYLELMADSMALTKSERDVARLVAAGRSNKEIAYERGSAPETVKAQLKTIFRKAGVTSRVELTARLMGG